MELIDCVSPANAVKNISRAKLAEWLDVDSDAPVTIT
jgi:hypothetical protein